MPIIPLTREQSKPVNSDCRVNVCLACPGSGKTTVLVARAERLWRETREPILIVTFSNDACNNIIKKLAPEAKASIVVKTIHSFCYDIVKTYWKEVHGIMGGDRWPNEPRLITKEQEIGIISNMFEGDNASALYETFAYMRDLGTNPEHILSLFKKRVYFEKIRQIDIEKFIEFERTRKSTGLITFDDMIDIAEVLIPLPYIATELSRKYSHILIDEAQDTSDQQWKILRPMVLNSCTSLVVGDYNQCMDKNTLINILNQGQITIDRVKTGDKVLCAVGKGQTSYKKVTNVVEHKVTELVKVYLKSGKELISSLNHTYFASFIKETANKHLVYLMFKEGVGYRIGKSMIHSQSSSNNFGFQQRCLSEHADRVWVIDTFDTEEEALVQEQLYSLEYRIPTTIFNSRNGKQETIERIFRESAIFSEPSRLMKDRGLSFDKPTYQVKAMSPEKIRNFTISLCAAHSNQHRIYIGGSDKNDSKILSDAGFAVRIGKRNKGWRIESAFKDYTKCLELYEKVKGLLGECNLRQIARIHKEHSLDFIPASQVRPGMFMVNASGDLDEVSAVSRIATPVDNPRLVYDLDVEDVHNYIANDIVVHNSIYGWRNADGSILLNMGQMKDSVIFRLSKSFRSGSLIANLANKICYDKTSVIVPQDHLGSVEIKKFLSVEDEVKWVLNNIVKNTAIISRTNNYLEKFERACIEKELCYLGKSFYRSEHIEDLYRFVSEFSGSDAISVIEKAYVSNSSYNKIQVDDFKLVIDIITKEGLSKFTSLVEKSRYDCMAPEPKISFPNSIKFLKEWWHNSYKTFIS